jgi:hypothetical protein
MASVEPKEAAGERGNVGTACIREDEREQWIGTEGSLRLVRWMIAEASQCCTVPIHLGYRCNWVFFGGRE